MTVVVVVVMIVMIMSDFDLKILHVTTLPVVLGRRLVVLFVFFVVDWIVLHCLVIVFVFLLYLTELYCAHTWYLSFFVRQRHFEAWKMYAKKCINLQIHDLQQTA